MVVIVWTTQIEILFLELACPGYIQKRQPVGKFALRQAAMNLKALAKTIQHRTSSQQYHHVANRMLGDLEYRGHVRPATEECNLAANVSHMFVARDVHRT